MSTGLRYRAQTRRTVSVPETIVSIVRTGWSMMSRTPTAEARCMTASHWRAHSVTRSALLTLPRMKRKRPPPSSAATFS